MRVIAGKARRILLKSLEGDSTRPTLDRYKETLFNTMQTYVPDSYFIDVFAGTGSIGIEALSRGAAKAVFIENNKKALAVIKENLEKRVAAEHGATEGKLKLAKRAKELNLDAIHDTVHEMARDEARHGKAFAGLLKRYFEK